MLSIPLKARWSAARWSGAMAAVLLLASACGGAAQVDESVASGAAAESAVVAPAPTGEGDSAADSDPSSEAAPVPAESEAASSEAAAAIVPELVGEFTTINGSQIDLNSLQGQDVVLWFWAPW